MPVIGITGGVATGKSTFTQALLRRRPAELFDADQSVHALLEGDAEVRLAVGEAFGEAIYNAEGKPNRSRLRELVFSDEQSRKRLEEILHPAIRARWTSLAERVRQSNAWLFVDIPLLYETGAESHCDRVVVVACSPRTQRRRLAENRGLDSTTAQGVLSAQLELETKIKRADHLIWNDSTVSALERQVDLLAAWLNQSYG
ncbi:MAG: dephospho-CoA kinase [Chthoniobacteraceae bacterium]